MPRMFRPRYNIINSYYSVNIAHIICTFAGQTFLTHVTVLHNGYIMWEKSFIY